MKKPRKPSAAELEILRYLWENGPSTVREVHEELGRRRKVGYTGVLKTLQIMTAKGSVLRDEESRAHIYRASEPPETTKRQVAGDMLRSVFAGSASQLLLHALDDKSASKDEIAEIRRIIEDYETRKR